MQQNNLETIHLTFTITKYKGVDPEVNRLGLNPGVDDRDKFPTVRTFTTGLNLTF